MRPGYDVVILGAGPAGLFAADRLSFSKKNLRVLVIDERRIPGGSGAVTDGKLNLTPHIGMDIQELGITQEQAQNWIDYIDSVFVKHGADESISGQDDKGIKKWVEKAQSLGVTFIPALQRHMGTDRTHLVVKSFKQELEQRGVEFLLKTRIEKILRSNGRFYLKSDSMRYHTQTLLIAPGRRGAYWFRDQADNLGIKHRYGPIDVGIRVEVPYDVMAPLTDLIYDPKIKYVTKRGDRIRTFCTNPGGRVRIEPKEPPDLDFVLVNGDAMKKRKTPNTNFAILQTINLTEPYEDTTEMGRSIARETNRLGGGNPIIQRMGHCLNGSRSRMETFSKPEFSRVKPTLTPGVSVVPGDISLAYRARTWENLIEFLHVLDKLLPGIAHASTILYAPEIKFYDTKYPTDQWLETNLPGLFIAGDGVGKSRGIVGAALTGIMAAQGILNKT